MGALDGYRVLDLTGGLCGPYATMRLADAGASVTKVEPLDGDPGRGHGPPFLEGTDMAAAFAALNRGKRSVALDCNTDAGAALVRRLARDADIVVEDLGPGRADAAGIGYEALRAENPGLVYGAISAYGEAGPWRERPGAELTVQAASDYWACVGRVGEAPVRVGADLAAMNTAIMLNQAVIAALFGRLRHPEGRGQRVAVSMLGTLLHTRGVLWAAQSNPDRWIGFHLDTDTRGQETGYRTKDGRIYFALRRADSEQYDTLMIQLGLVEYLDDERFGNLGRNAAPMGRYTDEAKEVWEEGFGRFTSAECVAMLLEAGGDAVELTDYATITNHAQTEALGILIDADAPGGGTFRTVGPVARFSDTPAQPATSAPPRLGEHTDAILAGAGLTAGEIGALRAAGTVR